MENLIELLKQQQEGYDDIKAEKKLSLFYHKAHSAGKEFNFPRDIIVDDWKSLVNREDIDAVIIATPDQQHREQCVAFLEAGKHVMCEKPLALNREDLDAIIAASKKQSGYQ